MKVCNLSSGSDGNCTYIWTEQCKILIDAGLSASEIEKRLAYFNVAPDELDGILISHEHTDHICGLNTLLKKNKIRVFVHEEGSLALRNRLKTNCELCEFTDAGFTIKDLDIKTVSLSHDAQHCSGFIISENDKKMGIITDLGHTNEEILSSLWGSKLVFLESNYDYNMLINNPKYPTILKKRILGKSGHLSNVDCAKAVLNLAQNGVPQIVLSHLSRKNNEPRLAYDTIKEFLAEHGIEEGTQIKIDVADIVPTVIFNL